MNYIDLVNQDSKQQDQSRKNTIYDYTISYNIHVQTNIYIYIYNNIHVRPDI